MFTHIIARGLFGKPLAAVLLVAPFTLTSSPGDSTRLLKFKLAGRPALPCCLLPFLLQGAIFAAEPAAPKRALALYWYGRDFSTNVLIDKGMRKAFQSVPAGTVEYYAEYLENNRFPGESQSLLFRDYLRRKYSDHKPDVIIAESLTSVNFLLKYRKDFFPDVPIVYCAFKPPDLISHDGEAGITGVVSANSYKSTLDLALRLHPATKQAYIIVRAAPDSISNLEMRVRDQLKDFENRVALTYLTHIPSDELISRVRTAPEESVILYVRYSEDGPDKFLSPGEALDLITQSAAVPIYSANGFWLGRGIVGGYSPDYEGMGVQLAEVALRVANGARPQDIPVVDAPNLPMLDWRQLQRWGISEDSLPPGNIIKFMEISFWRLYKWRIIGVASLCAVEALLILGLLAQRARRRRVEEALRDNEERLNLALSAANMGVWDWRLDAKELMWSDETRRIFDLTNRKSGITPEAFLDLVSPDDRPAVSEAITRTLKQGALYDVEFRVAPQDGGERWMISKGIALMDEAGRASRMLGVYMDVTARKQGEQALRDSEQRFRQLAENIGAVFFITDWFGENSPRQVVYISPAYEKIWGRSRESVYRNTRSWLEAVHPEDRERILAALQVVGGAQFDEEFRIVRSDGEVRWVHDRVFPICDERGEIYRLAGIAEDITVRKQAEDALRESEERYRSVVESQTELICRYLPDTTLTFVNDAYCRYFGRTSKDLIGVKFLELIPESSHDEVRGLIESLVQRPRIEIIEHEVLLPDGGIGWQQWVGHAIRGPDGKIVEFQGVGRDITERKRAEQSLQESEDALRKSYARITDLAGRLIAAQEDERRHIARELHDDLNQQVASLAIDISRLKRQFPNADPAFQEQIARLREKTEIISERVRQVSYELHSSILQHLGLPAALNSYCAEFSEREGIAVALDIQDGLEALLPDTALCLYRVAQESLRNIARHSGARSAIMALAGVDGAVELRVADQGVGFDPGHAREFRGLGLVSMEERVKLLGGSFVLTTRPGMGTELRAQIPLRREHEQTESIVG